MTSDPFTKVANDFKSVCWQQPLNVSDGCLTVWWPWDRSCFSVSRLQLWCTCTDLAFWMVAVWTGSGSGGCCPWWSCHIRCCKCPGGQLVWERGIPSQLYNWMHSTEMCLLHLTQTLWIREVWGAAIINITHGHAVMGEQGVQEGAEHTHLWGPCVWDQHTGGVVTYLQVRWMWYDPWLASQSTSWWQEWVLRDGNHLVQLLLLSWVQEQWWTSCSKWGQQSGTGRDWICP